MLDVGRVQEASGDEESAARFVPLEKEKKLGLFACADSQARSQSKLGRKGTQKCRRKKRVETAAMSREFEHTWPPK